MSVAIVTDSSCDLPSEIAARFGIVVVRLCINVGAEDLLSIHISTNLSAVGNSASSQESRRVKWRRYLPSSSRWANDRHASS